MVEKVMSLVRTGLALCVVLVFCLARMALPWRAVERFGWALVLRLFRVSLAVQGQPAKGGVLMLANHVSWIDIAALGRASDACFVAKSEVGTWPVIGPAARHMGCLFVDRGSRRSAQMIAAQIGARLIGGRNVIVFPEGTTGPGDGALPFRSTLTGATTIKPLTVQPVTLVYRSAGDRALAAWLGDASLLPHALALARSGGITLEIWFEQPFVAPDRKAAASWAEAAVAGRLARELDGQAATLKRVA